MTTDDALRNLEAGQRRLARALYGSWLLGGAVLTLGALTPARTVEAERFILRDRAGNVRAILQPTAQGSELVLYDFQKRRMATIGTLAIGPILSFSSEKGQECARLQVAKGQPVLSLYDEKNQKRSISAYVQPELVGLVIRDAKENRRLEAVDTPAGPEVRLNGKARVTSR